MSHWIYFKESSATGLRSPSDSDLLVVLPKKTTEHVSTCVLSLWHIPR